MKILVVLTASLVGFGLTLQNTADSIHQSKATAAIAAEAVEQPVMEVLLDTVEITVEAPVQIAASNVQEGVLLDTVEIVATAPRAIAANAR